MQIIKEKVVGRRGTWIVKARTVSLHTAQTGKIIRHELFLEEVIIPGEPRSGVGFAIDELTTFHNLLASYISEQENHT